MLASGRPKSSVEHSSKRSWLARTSGQAPCAAGLATFFGVSSSSLRILDESTAPESICNCERITFLACKSFTGRIVDGPVKWLKRKSNGFSLDDN